VSQARDKCKIFGSREERKVIQPCFCLYDINNTAPYKYFKFIIHSEHYVYTVNLTFMGPCIANIFQYISKKMQLYRVYLYLEIALHVSGGTITHYQQRKQLYLQHLVFVTPLLLPAASGR
jgi:hypothetical protein